MNNIIKDLKENSFKLRGKFEDSTARMVEIVGFFSILIIWQIIAMRINDVSLLPSPIDVVKAFKMLLLEKGLLPNAWFSLKINLIGIFEASIISIPIGFIIGLFPIVRHSTKKYVDALRYLPLGAVIGLFIVAFGIGVTMKAQFLTFAIVVYLIPTVILRIAGVPDEYEQTAYTMGATKWQIIRKIYMPEAIRKVYSDIINLVAISWTYITIVEIVNKTSGLGAMIYEFQRQSKLDLAFAVLFFIITIGFCEDGVFRLLGNLLYPSNYKTEKK